MEATKTKPRDVDDMSRGEINDRIAVVERRLENRRARLLEDARESAHAAGDTARRFAPIAAAVGAGLVAMYLVRGRKRRVPSERYYIRVDEDGVTASEPRRGVRWASIAGILGTAFRIATSPQFRAILQHYRERRQRPDRY